MRKIVFVVFIVGIQSLCSQSISSLNDSIRKYTIQDPKKALDFGYQAISTSDFNKLSWDVYDTNYLIGETLYYINFEKESFDYLFQALRVFENLPVEQRLFKHISKPPWILVTLGNSYFNYGEYERARNFYYEAIENFELYEEKHKEDKFFGLNTVEGNLAMISYTTGDFEKSWRQICVYAYPKSALIDFVAHGKKTPLELMEDLEILRFLELGYEVRMIPLSSDSIAVDVPEDIERVKLKLNEIE